MNHIVATIVVALALIWGTACGSAGKPARDNHVLSLAQVPAPVRATLEREAGNGKVETITRQTGGDGTYYIGYIGHLGRKTRYVYVAPDGTIVRHSRSH